MLKTFPIEFIRQTFVQKLLEAHNENPNYYGGNDQVNILSFYEQLKSQEEVDRFVNTFRDLTKQQNRSDLILNGVLLSPENPTITNLYSCLIVPMTWTCSLRTLLANRDQSIETINNLSCELKGKKVDIAQLECEDEKGKKFYEPFVVGTIGQNNGVPTLKNGDYIGDFDSVDDINDKMIDLMYGGVKLQTTNPYYLYIGLNQVSSLGNVSKTIKVVKGIISTNTKSIEVFNNLTDSAIAISNYSDDKTTISFDYSLYVDKNIDTNLLSNSVDLKFQAVTPTLPFPRTDTYTTIGTINSTTIENNKLKLNIHVEYNRGIQVANATINPLLKTTSINLYKYSFEEYEDSEENDFILFPPEHVGFEKYKLSLSFDAIRCDEPRNLNEHEYCDLTFSGSATLVSNGVQLGNDLLKVGMAKYRIKADTPIVFNNATTYYLEPLEMPSGNNANTQINQLVSNKFKSMSHTDAISLTLQYTFICDKTIPLLKQFFEYGRYGTQGISVNDISPNMEFVTSEIWCSWGEYENHSIITKIVENIDNENTESDAMTLSMTMQIQENL